MQIHALRTHCAGNISANTMPLQQQAFTCIHVSCVIHVYMYMYVVCICECECDRYMFRHSGTNVSVRDLLCLFHPHTVPGQDSPVYLPPPLHNQQPSKLVCVCVCVCVASTAFCNFKTSTHTYTHTHSYSPWSTPITIPPLDPSIAFPPSTSSQLPPTTSPNPFDLSDLGPLPPLQTSSASSKVGVQHDKSLLTSQ